MQPVTAAPLVLHHALMTPGKHFVNRSPLFLAGWLAGWVAGALGGTRTPNLLIRSRIPAVQLVCPSP